MNLEEIKTFATNLHAGQTDKSGRPYINHPERVAAMVRASGGDWVQESAAWLHDAIEDTGITADSMLRLGVPSLVVELVEVLTHQEHESNQDYWRSIRANPRALVVKLSDIYDNLDPSRLCYLDAATQSRLRTKYANAMLNLIQ